MYPPGPQVHQLIDRVIAPDEGVAGCAGWPLIRVVVSASRGSVAGLGYEYWHPFGSVARPYRD
jgi:hypothetical protein